MKSSRSENLTGSQEPSVRVVPDCAYSDGEDAAKIIKASGLTVDEWQRNILIDWMGRKEDGSWSASVGGLSVPRQNGKTLNANGRIASGMIMNAEWIIYTAHLQKTSSETFLELKGIFETPQLFKYVKEIKSAIGREQILLKNGGRVVFVARTRNGGRGLHGDLLIVDEAQEITPEQLASFLPALSASKNPQTIYLGTPPDENTPGTVFRNIRKRATGGNAETTAWAEWSVDEIGNVHDKERWAKTNPALGKRIKIATIEAECEQMDADTFARERLGWWSPIAADNIDYAIDKKSWLACKSTELKPEGKTAYGIKFSADGSTVCLCGAVCPTDGKARISLIDIKPTAIGLSWLANWLNSRYGQASCVVIDGRNGVDVLVDKIADTWKHKDSILRPTVKDVLASVSLLTDEINEKTVTWYAEQDVLNESAITSTKRAIGGGWGFGGENSTPIEAAALALWGCRNSKRDPNKKARIG